MSYPVTVTLVVNVKPEAMTYFCDALREMLKDTKKFPGFRSIRIMRHRIDANQVLFVEEWETEDDYKKYVGWRTERGDFDRMGPTLSAPLQTEVWPILVAN
jgi:quinol monooxygenase YgiN